MTPNLEEAVKRLEGVTWPSDRSGDLEMVIAELRRLSAPVASTCPACGGSGNMVLEGSISEMIGPCTECSGKRSAPVAGTSNSLNGDRHSEGSPIDSSNAVKQRNRESTSLVNSGSNVEASIKGADVSGRGKTDEVVASMYLEACKAACSQCRALGTIRTAHFRTLNCTAPPMEEWGEQMARRVFLAESQLDTAVNTYIDNHARLEQEIDRLRGALPHENDYVAWMRFSGEGSRRHLVICDSDAPKAFRVYRIGEYEVAERRPCAAGRREGSGMTDTQYTEANYSMYGCDETEIKCRTVKLVIAKKAHDCMCPACNLGHHIKPGERCVADKAIVDGSWGTCYTCLPCLESWERHCKSGGDYCTVSGKETKA